MRRFISRARSSGVFPRSGLLTTSLASPRRQRNRPESRKLSAKGSELDLSFAQRIEDLRRVGTKETSALTRKLIESLDTVDDMELTALRIRGCSAPQRGMTLRANSPTGSHHAAVAPAAFTCLLTCAPQTSGPTRLTSRPQRSCGCSD